jgi:hypothetical protein
LDDLSLVIYIKELPKLGHQILYLTTELILGPPGFTLPSLVASFLVFYGSANNYKKPA